MLCKKEESRENAMITLERGNNRLYWLTGGCLGHEQEGSHVWENGIEEKSAEREMTGIRENLGVRCKPRTMETSWNL